MLSANGDGGGGGSARMLTAGCAVAAAGALYGLYSVWRMRRLDAKLRPTDSRDRGCPPPAPLVGHVPLVCSKGLFASLAARFDDPWCVLWLGSSPFIVLNTLSGVRQALATQTFAKPKYFGYRSAAIKTAVSTQKHAVAAESAELDSSGDHSRVALEHLIQDRFHWLTQNSHAIVMHLAEASAKQGAFAVLQQSFVALNLKLLYGFDDPQSAADIAKWIGRAGLEFAQRMLNPFRVYYRWLANLRYTLDVCLIIQAGRRLCRHLDSLAARSDVESEHLPAATWVHAWLGRVGKVGKLGKVIGLLMASTQTVPLTALWALYLIATAESGVRRKLYQELHNVLGDLREVSCDQLVAALNVEQLDAMTYLDGVVRETLRLYPPFPVLQRQAQVETSLAEGQKVPAGTVVYIVPWMIHHNPAIWKDPEAFRPERFTEASVSHGDAADDYAFIPFGRGSRMCAGYRLALVEVKLVLLFALFLYEWDASGTLEAYPALNMVPRKMEFSFRARSQP